jgi:signal peptidase I
LSPGGVSVIAPGRFQYSTRLPRARSKVIISLTMLANAPVKESQPVLQSRKNPRPGSTLIKQILQCIAALGLGLASYYVISHFFVQSVQVIGSSMTPTLHSSEVYLLNRWIYHFRPPRRADVVVIRDPSARCYSVKRVVGVAGDSIYLKDGKVYLNGRKLDEPYLPPRTPTYASEASRDQLVVCGEGQYFLLGDNRMNSADSRSYGPVARGNILGMLVR